MRNAYKISVGISEVKELFVRLARRWEGNINTYLKEMGFMDMD
jgi:hypothetical protein